MMKTTAMLRFTLLCTLLTGAAAPCDLLVAAASDLSAGEKRLATAIPGCRITFSFGSSGTLARQIEHGAEFDVYLSAGRPFVDRLVAAKAVDAASVRPYALGRLGLWSSKGLQWRNLQESRVSQIAIANPAHAPYGLAARQALEKQGLWATVQPRIVFGENVRQAWQFAATGNADVTITAWTLVHDKGGQLLPASWHRPIEQVAAIPVRSRNPQAARRFLDWLTSPAGQKVLSEAGLEPVRR